MLRGACVLAATPYRSRPQSAMPPNYQSKRPIQQTASPIRLTENQKRFMSLVKDPEIPVVICTGPAGSGKTMIPCLYAVMAMREERFDKVVVTRPAVGAGEDLGFLPGTLQDKTLPYMRPILDLLSPSAAKVVEICPVAFLRGRSFDRTFVMVDEAQNTTPAQMRMILTRIGTGSKMVVTGDVLQSDIGQGPDDNGLADIVRIFKNSNRMPKNIRLMELADADVRRSPAAGEVMRLYSEDAIGMKT